jgi:tetratricopeptide (TPR) repeat protein
MPPEVSAASAEARYGKYVAIRLLGAGGMGEVWQAWDTELSRWVALKFTKSVDAGDVQRFRREATIAARLVHPNIAAIYEVGQTGDRHWIAMQFVSGSTLKSSIAAGTDVRVTARHVVEAARAVDHAHGEGIIHRDLKPENLMVDAAGRVFVMDFGLARPVDGGGSLTATGMAVGTPGYMSPEQARGEKSDRRADVYGLGAVLYEAASRRPPFEGSGALEILMKVIEGEPERLRGVDRDLETIVMKSLEKEPSQRYATAGALADDLDRWLRGEPVLARPVSIGTHLARRLAKRKAAAVATVVAIIALAIAAFVVPQWLRERAARADERRMAEARLAASGTFKKALMELNALRLRTYKRSFRIESADFDRLRALAEECRTAMTSAGETGDGWYAIGRTQHVLGDRRGAERDYRAGLRVDPAHASCTRFLARLLVERSVSVLYGSGEVRENRKRSEALAREAQALLASTRGASGAEDIDLDLAAGYELLAQRADVTDHCARMLEKWRTADFREEFRLLEAMAYPSRAEPLTTEVIAEREGMAEAWLWRGIFRSMNNRIPEALADLARALEINPRMADGHFAMGNALTEKGDLEAAGAAFEKAFALDPAMAEAAFNLGNTRRRLKDMAGAIAAYTQAIESNPRYADAFVSRGVARDMTGDEAGCRRDLDEALSISPRSPHGRLNRAALRRRNHDYAGCLEDVEVVIEEDADNGEAHLERGRALIQLDRKDAAIEALRRGLHIAPSDVPARFLLARLLDERGESAEAAAELDLVLRAEPTNVEALSTRAVARERIGDAAGAVADLDRAISQRPDNAHDRNNRSVLRRRLGDLAGARIDADRAVELAPDNVDYILNRALVLLDQDEIDASEAAVSLALKLAPRHAHAFEQRGCLKQRRGDLKGAIADFTTSIELDGGQAQAWRNRGLARQQAGDLGGALDDFDRAISLSPRDLQAWMLRAEARLEKGDLRGGFEDFTEVLRRDPKNRRALFGRGTILQHVGRFDEAIADFDKAWELGVKSPDLLLNRGNAREGKGDFEGALADFNRAIELDGTYAMAYVNRAQIRRRAGDPARALEDLAAAIKADPRLPEAYGARAQLREESGDFKGAVEDYEAAIRVAPKSWRFRALAERDLQRAKERLSKPE